MPITHKLSNPGVVITFIQHPIAFDEVTTALDALARHGKADATWHQVAVLGENTLGGLGYVDLLTLADWISEVGEGFAHSYLALSAIAEADFNAACNLAGMVVNERMTFAVFRHLVSARRWSYFPAQPAGPSFLQARLLDRFRRPWPFRHHDPL